LNEFTKGIYNLLFDSRESFNFKVSISNNDHRLNLIKSKNTVGKRKAIRKLFYLFDKDLDGFVDYKEFIEGIRSKIIKNLSE
jgi:Ca2+-binding EF-hand superfamily protein